MNKLLGTAAFVAALFTAGTISAFECKRSEASFDKPGGFPERALTMIVPYGPAGGSGQVAAAMAEAVTGLTGIPINRDHKPGGSGTVGMTAYMAAPADGYNVLEHIDDASSAHALDSSLPNPAEDLIPLAISQVTFSQIYIRSNETRFTDWPSFVEWVKAQDGKATIANVSKEGSMERVTMRFITEGNWYEKSSKSRSTKVLRAMVPLLGGQVDALCSNSRATCATSLDAGQFKPILTIFDERPGVVRRCADAPRDGAWTFDPLAALPWLLRARRCTG